MRIVLASGFCEINELMKKIDLNVEDYDWVISDVTETMIYGPNYEYVGEVVPEYMKFLFIKGENFKAF